MRVVNDMTKVKSGISGFDEIIGGGLEQRCLLLHGGPGSGKTTLTIQFLVNGALEHDEPGIFVSLSEDPAEIRKNMLRFGWDLAKLEKDNRFQFIDARPVTFTKEGYIVPNESLYREETIPFSHITRLITDSIAKMKAKRLALDSITVLTNQYETETYVRRGLLGLIQVLNSLSCTSILISEDLDGVKPSRLSWALVPGVVLLYYARKASSMVRAIQVLKMRGTKHSEEIHHIEIGDRGIVVHPEERAEL